MAENITQRPKFLSRQRPSSRTKVRLLLIKLPVGSLRTIIIPADLYLTGDRVST